MLIMEEPPVFHVEYYRLDAQASIAEAQKDVLAQMLRIALPEKTFTEGNESVQGPFEPLGLECVRCQTPGAFGRVIPSSVRMENATSEKNFDVVFSLEGEKQDWRVSVRNSWKPWVVRLKRGVSAGEHLVAEWLSIEPCERNCRPENSYPEKADAEKMIEVFVAKAATRYLAARSVLDSSLVGEPLKVRSQEKVRVLFISPGGIELRLAGKALASGAVGDKIPVEIQSLSNKTVRELRITEDGEVTNEL